MRAKKQTEQPYPDAPSHLSVRSQGLWRTLGPVYARSTGRQQLFRAALESLDRADAAREVIDREGMTFKTESTGAVHVHPALKIEKDSRSQFARLWDQLGLDWDNKADGQFRDY